MKLLAVTYGTEGDTRPLAALSRALIDAGHEVTLLADAGTLGSARELKVPYLALAGDIRGLLNPEGGISSVVSGKSSLKATTKALAKIGNENAESWMRQILEAGANKDAIIVAGLAAYIGFSVAEKLGIPAIAAGMIPLTPTSAFPSPFLPPRSVPSFLNRFSSRLVAEALWRAFRDSTNAARASVGLRPGRKIWEGHPVLYGISPTILPKPTDWPGNVWMCGQWVRPLGDWECPRPLQDFLAAGEPPIYVGFGSMVGFDQRALLEVIVTAVAGRRVLFYPGWSNTKNLELPANFFTIGDTPHDWLFPRTSLVIHHGGSGTTHSAVRAGVPSVILPFAADQFFWADRLRQLGVGLPMANGKRVTAKHLANAIDPANASDMRERASALGAKMRNEDGLQRAIEAIHSVLCQ